MTDDFTRPYVDDGGKLVYLTDAQYVEMGKHGSPPRKLRAGELITPEVEPVVQIAPNPATAGAQATDRGPVDPRTAHPVPEVRERENF